MHDSKSQLTTPLDINYLQNVLENEQTRTEITWWESNVQLKAADSDPALWQWQPRSHFQYNHRGTHVQLSDPILLSHPAQFEARGRQTYTSH